MSNIDPFRPPPSEPKRQPAEQRATGSAAEGAEFVFEGVKIRTTPDGRMAASDVLRALGLKDPSGAWKSLKKNYPDLMASVAIYSFGRGRPPEVLGERGVYKLAIARALTRVSV